MSPTRLANTEEESSKWEEVSPSQACYFQPPCVDALFAYVQLFLSLLLRSLVGKRALNRAFNLFSSVQ